MFPPGALAERVAMEDDIIPLSKPIRAVDGSLLHSITIQKGQTIYISRVANNTRPSVWGPDGNIFRPSRWLELAKGEGSSTPQATVSGWNNLDSFAEGAHMCIGYRLAVFEIKVILAALVKAFIFEPVDGVKIAKKVSVDVQPLLVDAGEAKEFRTGTFCMPLKVSIRGHH